MTSAIVDLAWRAYPAGLIALTGCWLAVSGVRLGRDWARWHDPARNLRFIRGFRRTIIGLALIAFAAAWLWQLLWLLVLALAIAGEELLESSVHAFAVRRGITTGAVPANEARPSLARTTRAACDSDLPVTTGRVRPLATRVA